MVETTKDQAHYTEDVGEMLQKAGIKTLSNVAKNTKTKIVYEKRTHKILGYKPNKK